MASTNETLVVLWHSQLCNATIYECNKETGRKQPITTETFLNGEARLGHKGIETIKIITPAISLLSNLSSLRLQNNRIETVPPEIWLLSGLRELNLSSNRITVLSPQIAQLKQLKELYIHNNRIQSLPPQLGRMQLDILDVTENNLHSLPHEVAANQYHHFWYDFNHFDSPGTACAVVPLRITCLWLARNLPRDKMAMLPLTLSSCLLREYSPIDLQCSICDAYMPHEGFRFLRREVIQKKQMLTVSYCLCSQSCWNKLWRH